MENFQLYRTNILLSGQMAWDLILDNKEGSLEVTDFHLTPINIKSPKYVEENLVNYPHQENIKSYYKKHEGSFYDTNLNPKLKHDWVVLGESGKVIYEDSFEAGASYDSYQLYKKPLSVLCPVWLEQLKPEDTLSFKISIYTDKQKFIGAKTIDLTNDGYLGEYFKQYIKYVGISNGIDDVLDINMDKKIATMTGLDANTGLIVKKDISYIIQNLLHRERPMLEFDAMLINLFPDNHVITRQLFNFRLHFDLADLLSGHLSNMLYGNKLSFDVRVMINGKALETRDFYSNYTHIDKENIDNHELSYYKSDLSANESKIKYNVLDYLMDKEYIEHINKNKYVQNVVHWSLVDNTDYLFNIYNGFGAYCQTDPNDPNTLQFFSHRYGNTPDLLNPTFSQSTNSMGWCNSVIVDNFQNWLALVAPNPDSKYFRQVEAHASNFIKQWVNKVKYDKVGYEADIAWEDFKMLIFLADEVIYNKIIDHMQHGVSKDFVQLKDGVCFSTINSYFMGLIIRDDCKDDATFVGINNLLKNDIQLPLTNHPLMYLKDKLKKAKSIPLISIDKSLFINKAGSPSLSSTEIEYYKDDNAIIEDCYVLRYDGKIKPTFISQEQSEFRNSKYYKVEMTEDEYNLSEFKRFETFGYSPLYPSIGFCAIQSQPMSFDKLKKQLIILIPEISVKLNSMTNKVGRLLSIKDVVKNYLKELYNTNEVDFIYNLYDIESSYEYKSNTNLKNYVYDVKLILK